MREPQKEKPENSRNPKIENESQKRRGRPRGTFSTVSCSEAERIVNAAREEGSELSRNNILRESGVRFVRDDSDGSLISRIRTDRESEYINRYNVEHYTRNNIIFTLSEIEAINEKVAFLNQNFIFQLNETVNPDEEDKNRKLSVRGYMTLLLRKSGAMYYNIELMNLAKTYKKEFNARKPDDAEEEPKKRFPYSCRKDEMERFKKDAKERGFGRFTQYLRFLIKYDYLFIQYK